MGIEELKTKIVAMTQKFQNTRNSLIESVQTINRKGLAAIGLHGG